MKISSAIDEFEDAVGSSIDEEREIRFRNQIEEEMGYSWEENHAIGWVKVVRDIDGFLFVASKSDPPRPRRPARFFKMLASDECFGSLRSVSFTDCSTPEQFLHKMQSTLESIAGEEPFGKNCFVDSTQVINLHKHINWTSLINKIIG